MKPFFSQTIYNVSSDLGPIPTGWKQETEKDKAEVKKYKYTNTQSRVNAMYRKYKVAALETTMCSTVPLEDLYKRRWSVVSATFQCISIYFCCVCCISTIPKGVEGQEAGCPGQVEEGHGEGGGRQQLVDRRQEVTRPWNYWSEEMTQIPFVQILKRTMEWIDLTE